MEILGGKSAKHIRAYSNISTKKGASPPGKTRSILE